MRLAERNCELAIRAKHGDKDALEELWRINQGLTYTTRQVKREVTDHMLNLSMAKEIRMIQHRNIVRQIRRYLIEVENALQIPQVIAHSLMAAILDSHLWF